MVFFFISSYSCFLFTLPFFQKTCLHRKFSLSFSKLHFACALPTYLLSSDLPLYIQAPSEGKKKGGEQIGQAKLRLPPSRISESKVARRPRQGKHQSSWFQKQHIISAHSSHFLVQSFITITLTFYGGRKHPMTNFSLSFFFFCSLLKRGIVTIY